MCRYYFAQNSHTKTIIHINIFSLDDLYLHSVGFKLRQISISNIFVTEELCSPLKSKNFFASSKLFETEFYGNIYP